jgi:release factor glutamine methyltransferase
MTVRQLLADLSSAFHSFEDPKLEARHLLMEALSLDLNGLLLNGDNAVSQIDRAKVEMWKLERLKGMPLAYLSGHKSFYKSDFIVRPGVLVPRPETELVVTTALERAPAAKRILDLGCGSGCIGLSLLKELPGAVLTAVDQSSVACEVTRENAVKLNLSRRVEIVNKAVENLEADSRFDLIVANPPYIAAGDERVQKSVHDHEPHEALYAADEGLAAVRSWIRASANLVGPAALLVYEIGSGQSAQVREIMAQAGFEDIRAARDLQNIERVISARSKNG